MRPLFFLTLCLAHVQSTIPRDVQGDSSRSPWVRQYSYMTPDLFHRTVPEVRASCTWSKPKPMFEFIKEQARSEYAYLRGAVPLWPGECGSQKRFLAAEYLRTFTYVQVCHLVHVGDTSVDESILTRVGLGRSMTGINISEGEMHCLTLLTQRPIGYANKPSFLVESGDTYLYPNGSAIPYPPIHPHHSNSYLVGFQHEMTPQNLPAFQKFLQLPILSVEDFEGMDAYPASMNTIGFNADKLGCQHATDSAPCFFSKFPQGFGMPLYHTTDHWVDLMINKDSQDDSVERYIFELYRKYVTPKKRSIIQPLWMLDFSIVGLGYTYLHPRNFGPAVMWRQWTMPIAGTFMSSWYHTHSLINSEMVMLKGRTLTWRLTKFCSRLDPMMYEMFCSAEHFIKRRNEFCFEKPQAKTCRAATLLRNSTDPGVFSPVPLSLLGTDYDVLRSEILQNKGMRCHFKSQRREINGKRYALGGLIATNSSNTCDDWSFAAGATITMVAFVEKSDLTKGYEQHHRFWPLAKLDLPAEFLERYG